jgi:uncharacterized protein with PQ loop repeat
LNSPDETQKLVEDLRVVKNAVARSNNIFRFIDVSRAMALVGLWGGLTIAVLAGVVYYLTSRFGTYAEVPLSYRLALYISIGSFGSTAGIVKVLLLLTQARKTYRDITTLQLLRQVIIAICSSQSIYLIVSFASATVGVLVFLIVRDLELYIVPAVSLLLGLLYVAFVNVFYLKEMFVAGGWLVATGLITLFYAERIPSSLAVIITFACGFCLLYVANRLLSKAA